LSLKRARINKDGKDIAFQFFIEGQAVDSIDSILNNQTCLFSLKSIADIDPEFSEGSRELRFGLMSNQLVSLWRLTLYFQTVCLVSSARIFDNFEL
jgi:hypothetical protein